MLQTSIIHEIGKSKVSSCTLTPANGATDDDPPRCISKWHDQSAMDIVVDFLDVEAEATYRNVVIFCLGGGNVCPE